MILQRLYSEAGKKKLAERAHKKALKNEWVLGYIDPKETLGRASDEIREASKNQADEIVATGKRWKTLRNCPTITDDTGALRVARKRAADPGMHVYYGKTTKKAGKNILGKVKGLVKKVIRK